jgi:hypothetical protein
VLSPDRRRQGLSFTLSAVSPKPEEHPMHPIHIIAYLQRLLFDQVTKQYAQHGDAPYTIWAIHDGFRRYEQQFIFAPDRVAKLRNEYDFIRSVAHLDIEMFMTAFPAYMNQNEEVCVFSNLNLTTNQHSFAYAPVHRTSAKVATMGEALDVVASGKVKKVDPVLLHNLQSMYQSVRIHQKAEAN